MPAAPTATIHAPGTCDSATWEATSFLHFHFPFSQGREDHLPLAQHRPSPRTAAFPGLAWRGPGTQGQQGAFGTQCPSCIQVEGCVTGPQRGRD